MHPQPPSRAVSNKKDERKNDPHRTSDRDRGRMTAETMVTKGPGRGAERLKGLMKRVLAAPKERIYSPLMML